MVAELDEAASRNWLLRGIPDENRAEVLRDMQLRQLQVRDVVAGRGEEITEVVFPLSCVLSTVASATEESAIEVATIGNEGMSGVPVYLGVNRTDSLDTFVQIPGDALCMRSADFRRHLKDEEPFDRIMGFYVQAMLTQISQASACNRLHPADERCARWLLMSHDRVGKDEFELTQQFLAQMLGLRRATVSEVAGTLQDDGLIRYSRGMVTIADRASLEERSCECYQIIRREYERLLNGHDLRGRLTQIHSGPRR